MSGSDKEIIVYAGASPLGAEAIAMLRLAAEQPGDGRTMVLIDDMPMDICDVIDGHIAGIELPTLDAEAYHTEPPQNHHGRGTINQRRRFPKPPKKLTR